MTLPRKAYFIGIGGIGMSALAQLFADSGVKVSGSDREESPTTELLRKKGIEVAIGQKAENVPSDADLVVYTEAAWEDNPERIRANELGVRQISYFAALGEAAEGKRLIAVAGTHGKTTTTAMLAKILLDAGARPSAIVGSLVKDFGGNFIGGDSDWLVVEACEYKRDFLTLHPEVLVVTNIEWDHTDYYQDLADVQRAFRTLMERAKVVVTDAESPTIAPLLPGLSARVTDYARQPSFPLSLPGEYNRMNARAAAAAAREAIPMIADDTLRASLASFAGTWRRFDYRGKTARGADVYDDYAHHPTALRAVLAELRARTKGKLFVAFHPHLYSRTKDLLPEFATAFTGVDGVFIAPIYAAREVDDGSISSALLAKAVSANGTPAEAKTFEEIRAAFEEYAGEGDTVATIGAGDIYKVADALVAHT